MESGETLTEPSPSANKEKHFNINKWKNRVLFSQIDDLIIRRDRLTDSSS
jgi:hypothetical protein